MGKTVVQKIFDAHEVDRPDANVRVLSLDRVFCHEITTPIAINDLVARGKDRVFDPTKIKAVIDHVTPSKDSKTAEQAKTLIKQATAVVNKSGKLKEDLQSMHDEVEQADKTVRELLQKMLSAKKEYDMLKVEHQKELDSGSGEQQALENAVKEAAQNISPEILAEYNRIKGFRPNPVAILENSRCNGCNMQLPAGVSGRILKGDGIVTCENCGRILIIE